MKRYLTHGINEQIPINIQLFCWQCYDAAKVTGNYDYLQVFELKQLDEQTQQVEHRQEVPEYKQIYYLKSTNPINQKIFIIEEGEYVAMLLAEEY
ncbi:DUF960 domain-containing protein [Turicibacter sanguinis]|uniref:DUF960 domain-containing protein n=1 Tax=Turicibacter sanguinis TaxID=154288 RepID=UPI0021D4B4FB|nr:DUF960 domain-containing protein [Turicibacter sanguinis]MCU7201196.1 DUF960 domain-containing protein [Turicibacter sanguinis]